MPYYYYTIIIRSFFYEGGRQRYFDSSSLYLGWYMELFMLCAWHNAIFYCSTILWAQWSSSTKLNNGSKTQYIACSVPSLHRQIKKTARVCHLFRMLYCKKSSCLFLFFQLWLPKLYLSALRSVFSCVFGRFWALSSKY